MTNKQLDTPNFSISIQAKMYQATLFSMKCATFFILLLAVLLPLSSDFNLIARSINFSEAASPTTTSDRTIEDKATSIKINTKSSPKPEEVQSTTTVGSTNASITDTPDKCKNGTESCNDEPMGPIGRKLLTNSLLLYLFIVF